MSDSRITLRPATGLQIQAERQANRVDIWLQKAIDLDAATVAKAAQELWGPPVIGMSGDRLWRLWAEELDVPLCISVGVLPPALLFSGGMLPDDHEVDRLADEVRRTLLEVDAERVGG